MKSTVKLLLVMLLAALPALAQNGNQNGQLTRAEYGVSGQMADVTYLVASRIQNNALNFVVSNEELGGDPARGQRKILRLWIRRSWWDNKFYDFPEGATVNLQLSGSNPGTYPGSGAGAGGQQFVRAEYGVPGRFTDVTNRVRQQAQNGVFSCQVGNDCLGGDPPVWGSHPDQWKAGHDRRSSGPSSARSRRTRLRRPRSRSAPRRGLLPNAG